MIVCQPDRELFMRGFNIEKKTLHEQTEKQSIKEDFLESDTKHKDDGSIINQLKEILIG